MRTTAILFGVIMVEDAYQNFTGPQEGTMQGDILGACLCGIIPIVVGGLIVVGALRKKI